MTEDMSLDEIEKTIRLQKRELGMPHTSHKKNKRKRASFATPSKSSKNLTELFNNEKKKIKTEELAIEGKKDHQERYKWPPLESDPKIFTDYMHAMGLPAQYAFIELLGFEE